jgi:hypothetical protein
MLIFLPAAASAQGLVTCSGFDCNLCTFATTASNVVRFVTTLMIVISVVLLAVTGIQIAASSGKVDALQILKERLTNIVIGFLLIIAGWTLVDTVLKALVTDEGIVKTWQTPIGELCALSGTPVPGNVNPNTPAGRVSVGGGAELPPVSGVDLCNNAYLGTYFPGEEKVAQCVLQGESSCGALFYSATDYSFNTANEKVPFSVSPWQINLTVHEIQAGECASGPIDCKAAYTGKDFNSVLVNSDLYNQCVEALKDPACSGAVAKRINSSGRGWSEWSAYKRNRCNL